MTVLGALFLSRWYKKEKEEIVIRFKDEAASMIDEHMQGAIDSVGEALGELFIDPTVKKGFSLAGSLGGEAKAENAIVDSMATDMLDSPQFSAIRMGAEAIGLDIEGYIEKHGAIKTLSAAQQLAKVAGIDIMKIDLSNLGSLARPKVGGSDNPYLRR